MEATLTGTNEKEKQVLVVCVKRFGLLEMHLCFESTLFKRKHDYKTCTSFKSEIFSCRVYTST